MEASNSESILGPLVGVDDTGESGSNLSECIGKDVSRDTIFHNTQLKAWLKGLRLSCMFPLPAGASSRNLVFNF